MEHIIYRYSLSPLLIPALAFSLLCGTVSIRELTRAAASRPALTSKLNIPATRFDATIEASATEYGLDPLLIKAIIATESEFNDRCVSRKGAVGLMQLLPSTAKLLAVRNIFDPKDNIYGGTRHFRYLMNRFNNDLPNSLAAYNAGERNVIRYHGVPPFPETRHYVSRVLKIYNAYRA